MSSSDSIKKRRIAVSNGGGGDGIVDDGGSTTMSKILAKLNDMENRCISMQSELDSCISSRDAIQQEMDGMQSRLFHVDELEKKCTNLDTRCESLQRSVQILSKESKWEYSAPPVPLSHWRGFPENYINKMQTLLADIQGYTCGLRSGEASGRSIHLGQSDIFLQHDDILLPHWKEFANALQLHELNRYKIKIQNVQLTSEVLDLLAPALKGKPLRELILERNGFANNEGIMFSTECIKHNNELQHLDWINNQIDSTEDAMLLVDAIVSHPSVTKVSLDNCFGGISNSYEVVRPLFASDRTWEKLDLEGNNIRTRGGTEIPNYIASNPPLTHLYLTGNKLNDDDATLIARALKGNTNLKNLRIHNNTGITDIGNNALRVAIYDPTSLNSMSDCKHACIIHVDSDRGMNNSILISLGRGSKIYKLLSERNKEGSNVQHLNSEFEDGDEENDNSLKLVPHVLECVYRYYHNASRINELPLSIMYEILRGWKMPELYEMRR